MKNIVEIKAILYNWKSNILGDFLLKFIANMVQLVIKNIIILPALAMMFNTEVFGTMLTIISVITIIAAGLGNSLTSTRLIMEEEYSNSGLQGDFNLICLCNCTISMLGVVFIYVVFPVLKTIDLFVISLILFLETFWAYHSGWFILRQEYKKLLYYTMIGGVGYSIGLITTYFSQLWVLTYFIADLCYVLFLLKYSPLVREAYVFTKNNNKTIKKYLVLIITTLVGNVLTYIDRLLLYPMIGGEAVAIYTTAGVFGKAFSLLSLPVSTVLVGYFAVGRIKMDLNKYRKLIFVIAVLLLVFFLLTSLVGEWVTGLLYPKLIVSAAPFIIIANMASAIGASSQIIKSVALKYAKTYWLLVLQVVYAFSYICLSFYCSKNFGLYGFSCAALCASLINIIMVFIICYYTMSHLACKEN